jgi:hypothetical protein
LVLQLSALLLSVGSHRIQNGEVSFEMNIETQFERFMREKEYLLDRSAKTLTYLRTGAKHFLPIIAPAKNEGELRSLAQDAFHHVLELGVSGRSKNTYLGPLRTFLVRSYASGLGQTPRQRRQGGRMVREPGLPVRVRRPANPPENPRKQHFFLQGHDSKLKALALKIVRGEASADQIPDFTRDLRSCIKFLKKMPELRKAFE